MAATKIKTSLNETGLGNRIAETLNAPPTMKPQLLMFQIIGVSPLLQNNPAEFIGKSEGEGITTKKVYVDAEEAALRTYKDEDGQFCHPCEAFIKAMTKAVTGKKFAKLSAPAAIKGTVFIAEPFCRILDADGKPATEYTIDRRSVVINKKARILRCRPCWSDWTMKLVLEIDTAIMDPINIEQALALAGRVIGIGDYRPEKGGGYGRFTAKYLRSK